MSIISRAIEKKEQPGKAADAKSPPATPSKTILQHRREPVPAKPRIEEYPRISGPELLRPASPLGRQFLWVGLIFAAAAVGAGYFIVGRPQLPQKPPRAEKTVADAAPSVVQAPPKSEKSEASAPEKKRETLVPSATPALPAIPTAETTTEPTAAPTPLVVRVEVAVKSPVPAANDGSDGTHQESSTGKRQPHSSEGAGQDGGETKELKPLPKKSGAPPTLNEVRAAYKLDGIFFSEKDPMAVINDEIMKVGQKLEEMTVVKINPSSVVVKVAGQEYELR
ncbi:hypothetical protein HYR69_10285 [Candidatus Sumerlaeota bacterium]|nr:hypothetical protein [Candidatus Sumerlaeota bacterium]